MAISTKQIQQALKDEGFDPGPIDGIPGPKTNAAIIAFNKSMALPETVRLSPVALQILGFAQEPEYPWMNELGRYMGLHEVRDKKKLMALLRVGGTVGDPAKLPWCADLVESVIKVALPNEPFTGPVGINPYYSLNWLKWGIHVAPCYGAIAIFVRPGGGHIGFLVGYDPVRKRYRVRGGNQSNAANDCWVNASRLKGCRWPSTYSIYEKPLPVMNSAGAVVSRNEA